MSDEKETLLIIEDDRGLQKQLKWVFSRSYKPILVEDRESAIAAVRRCEPAVVTLDLGLPPDPANATQGLAALETILEISPNTKVVVVTGNEDKENALRAIAMGAYDFYQKPVDSDTFRLIVDRAFKLSALERENRKLLATQAQSPISGIVASSPEMLAACRMVEKIAPTNVTALVLGESGTGKELVAKAIHDLSPRKKSRFVAINCAAIPDTLLESELFGYEKGAFTGATKQTPGRIEYANNGTLFLDEIGDLPMALQAKLLRFLQERVIERLGGRTSIPVDVRVVCATNRDLRQFITEERFREDLFYRVSEISINIPSLRERKGDAIVLSRMFADRFAREINKPIKGFTESATAAIEQYDWPGNVRELENCIKRAVILSEGARIAVEDLGIIVQGEPEALNLREMRDKVEIGAITRAIQRCDGNLTKAAETLGITRPTLYALLDKHEIRPS